MGSQEGREYWGVGGAVGQRGKGGGGGTWQESSFPKAIYSLVLRWMDVYKA